MSSIYNLALRQQKDIERVVARSNVLSARVWRGAITAARKNKIHLASGQLRVQPIAEAYVLRVEQELLSLMSYAYLLRVRLGKRRRSAAKGLVLSLHTDASKIAEQFELDLGRLEKRFEPIAKKAVKKAFADINATMNLALTRATQEGRPTARATKDVISAIRKHGIQPRSNSYVETLVRTHAAMAYGAAHSVSFDSDPDVWGYQYVTVGDNRVREAHAEVDGTIRKKGDEFWDTWWPPNGWNCRCQVVAIYDDSMRQTRIPKGIAPDEGFEFDPGELAR